MKTFKEYIEENYNFKVNKNGSKFEVRKGKSKSGSKNVYGQYKNKKEANDMAKAIAFERSRMPK